MRLAYDKKHLIHFQLKLAEKYQRHPHPYSIGVLTSMHMNGTKMNVLLRFRVEEFISTST